ncbi:unnamed protein product [Bursaphelenchus xylophilus]|uniref:(pine wood nematode) hypothetical protein n=1 Tax=Bursaphelenchus xylophilus TaxID=6326 RepID=A0A1I7RJE1_BURXY|nr:srh-1 [Bursaphelenchus xylophilus]WJK71451.1 Srh [Bursaphelenchus xylophilus]CAD5233557.1 unnamed protein product [Bursaphelenchus xylophilus]CAG9128820.1 unnamed protein product [Bursaphelenchus xylophilus]
MQNITFYDVNLPSDSLRLNFSVYSWLLQPVNCLIFVLTVLVILQCSPKSMGSYKYYILWSVSNTFASMLAFSMYECELLPPYEVAIARGLPEALDAPFLSVFLQIMAYSCFQMNILINICRFTFRFAEATGQQSIVQTLSDRRFFLGLLAVFLAIVFAGLFTNSDALEKGGAFKRDFPGNNMALRRYVTDHILVYTESNFLEYVIQYAIFPIGLLFSAYCALCCYRFQRSASSTLSERTRRMYYNLINALIIEQASVIFWVLLPLLVILLAAQTRHSVVAAYIFVRILYMYPTFVMLFTLTFYKRYRYAVLRCFLGVSRNHQAASSVGSSSVVTLSKPSSSFPRNTLTATLPNGGNRAI